MLLLLYTMMYYYYPLLLLPLLSHTTTTIIISSSTGIQGARGHSPRVWQTAAANLAAAHPLAVIYISQP